jgi:hypothetical protein
VGPGLVTAEEVRVLHEVLAGLLSCMTLGMVLVVWGWRGKRLNRHPICRDCRFDLAGAPQGMQACPECGAGLLRRRAVRNGRRRKRWIVLALGSALAVAPALLVAALALAVVAGENLNTYKPTRMLIWEARKAGDPQSAAIASELWERYRTRRLSADEAARVVRLALAVQGDPLRPWAEAWGDILEDVRLLNGTDEDFKTTYRDQSTVLEWKARPRIRAGDPLPFLLRLKQTRCGATAQMMCGVSLEGCEINGKTVEKIQTNVGRYGELDFVRAPRPKKGKFLGVFYVMPDRFFGYGYPMEFAGRIELPEGLPPGEHVLELKVRRTVDAMMPVGRTAERKNEGVLETVKLRFRIEEKSADLLKCVEPCQEIDDRLQIALSPSLNAWGGSPRVSTVQQFDVDDLPVKVAYDVFWKQGEKETKAGTFTSGLCMVEGSAETDFMFGYSAAKHARWVMAPQGFEGKPFDIILRPNPDAALRTVDQDEIYMGEIVLKDVTFPERRRR